MRCTTCGTKPTREARVRSDVLVRRVAGVHDPVAIGEVGQREVPVAGRHPDAPLQVPQRRDDVVVAPLRRRQVVVVDEGQVDVVAGQQVQRLERLVLVDAHLDAGMGRAQVVDAGQQRPPDRRREPGHPYDARPALPSDRGRGGRTRPRRGSSRRGRPAAVRPESVGPACRRARAAGSRRRVPARRSPATRSTSWSRARRRPRASSRGGRARAACGGVGRPCR